MQDISDCLSPEAQNVAEARLAAKRAARAEAREIRMKELERQQKEIYQVQKKYYGLDAKWGDIEQWMASDDDDLMSVTSRSSLRTNGYEDELLGPSQYRKSSRSSTGSGETFQSSRGASRDEAMSAYYSDLNLASAPLSSKQQQAVHNGSRPSLLNCNSLPSRSQRGSLYDEGVSSSSRRSSGSRPPSEYSCYLGSGSRASSRASSARASPVSSEPPGPTVYRRGSNSASISSFSHLDDVSAPAMSRVEERPDKDFGEKEISELKEQIEDVEGKYMQGLKEMKDSLAEVEEKYKRSMVTNAQLDNEKTSLQYQVDTLREVLLELEEELAESRRQYEEKHKECERQKHDQNVLRFQLTEMKEALEQRESLLTEIRQLQQKHESSDREICDLKETIEWKDKKIGALERQKEFFEPVRSERDALREEVTRLRDELKKHGIALDSVGTPNGDASLEPPVNADGRPDPPIRATSMGPSEEAVEKKETMSVMGAIPASKTEQTNQEVLLTAPSETPPNAEVGDNTKEQNIQEIASISKDDVNTDSTLSVCQTNLEHQGEDLPLDSESTSNKYEMAMDESTPEDSNKKVLVQNSSEVHKETTVDQKNTNPVESDIFQDALENVVESPCVTSHLSEEPTVSVDYFWTKEDNLNQLEFNKLEDQCELQSTSVENNSLPNNGALEIPECRDNATVISGDINDLHSDTKDDNETSSSDDSSQDDSEESIADEMTTRAVEHEIVCEEEVKPQEQSVPVESGLQCSRNDSEKTEESIPAEVTVHADFHDPDPEQSSHIQLTKEEIPIVDSENNNFSEVPEPCMSSNLQSTVENEAPKDSEVFEDSVSHVDQYEDTTDAGSVNADLESPENGKTNTVFLDAPGTELLDIGEQNKCPDNPVSDQSETMNEKTNPVFSVVPTSELLDEGKPDKSSDYLGKSEITNDNIPVVEETPKDTVLNETLCSEGESTPEGEESDENNDNDDVAVRSEKYTGECLPLGSSVDQMSTDDIRMDDGSDKGSRKGKGKNKEDCVVS